MSDSGPTDPDSRAALGAALSDTPFTPTAPAPIVIPLADNPLNRRAELRNRPKEIDALRAAPGAQGLALWRGKAPVDLDGPRLAWGALSRLAGAAEDPPVFLGEAEGAGDRPLFAADLSALDEADAHLLAATAAKKDVKYIDLRSIASQLPAGEPGIYAEAKSLVEWHASHGCCARCGAATMMTQGGWRRDCPACDAKHFPRTDPRSSATTRARWPPR